MPFNKGDFTQQGVAGHVNANLRLNEKRLVNIDMTSNEEAEGCTITGNVKDLLNDKVYAIGSAPSGNIEITENGENINVAPYATATVNVAGGGDFSIANITLTNNTEGLGGPAILVTGAVVIDEEEYPCTTTNAWCAPGGVTKQIQIIMYKGRAEIKVEEENSSTHTITHTGDCEPGYMANTYWVTGDCTFTMA